MPRGNPDSRRTKFICGGVMKTAKEFFKKIRIDVILRAILLLIMAIMFFVKPENAMVSAATVFAIFILCDGIISMLVYFFTAGMSGFFGTTLLGSVFKILYGILFISAPDVSAVAFSLMFAIYIIAISCNAIEEALYLKRAGSYWLLPLILGFMSLAGGIVMLFMTPASLLKVSGIITGVTLLIACIEDVIIIIEMYKVKKRIDTKVTDLIGPEL